MTPSVLRPILLLLLVLIGLSACDVMPVRSPSSDAALQAERAYAQGHFAQAAEGFLQAAAAQRSQRDLYRLRAAEAWREEGDLDQADMALEGVSTRRLDAEAQARIGLLRAEIALARGEAEAALAHVQGLPDSQRTRYQTRALELRAQAALAQGDLFGAAALRAELGLHLSAGEHAFNQQEVRKLLARASDDALAFGTATLAAEHPLLPEAVRMLEQRGLPLPRLADGSVPPPALAQALDGEGHYTFTRIALLLPRSGPLTAAADAVRDGFISGYFNAPEPRPQIRLYDTGSTPEGIRAALQQALNDGAQALVGPLSREQVTAAFQPDSGLPAPTLALNRSLDAPPPPGSLSFAMTPEDEGHAAAERMLARGLHRVLVVLHSDDDYGRRAAQALEQRLSRQGGRIAATATLPANSPDYSHSLAAALGAGGEVQAIFFTGRAPQGHLLAPQLKVAGVAQLPIYATSQITVGSGNVRLDRELDGIEFTEVPWLLTDVPGMPRRERLAALESTHGSSARLFAFGLDAFRLLGHLPQLRQNPQAALNGATGQLRHDGFGQIVRSPGWARFRGGRIEAVREAGLIGDALQFRP